MNEIIEVHTVSLRGIAPVTVTRHRFGDTASANDVPCEWRVTIDGVPVVVYEASE